jgi:Zn-dependent peptidase ImmA (M78 family)
MQCETKSEPSAVADGLNLASKISKEFQTNDVFEIARRLNISIVYEKWFPVTLGEFDKKNRRITVNKNAQIPFEKIIAHELGHYFLEEIEPQRRKDAEKICIDFAEAMFVVPLSSGKC